MVINKKLLGGLLTALCTVTTSMSYAVDTTLSVSGVIENSACSISVGNGVEVGEFDARTLNTDTSTVLTTTAKTQISVNCATPTVFWLSATDNRTGVLSGAGQYREWSLGQDSQQNAIGAFKTVISNQYTDGTYISSMPKTVDNGQTWYNAWLHNTYITPGAGVYIGAQSSGQPDYTAPRAVSDWRFDLKPDLEIAPKNNLVSAQAINIDGSVTLSLYYP